MDPEELARFQAALAQMQAIQNQAQAAGIQQTVQHAVGSKAAQNRVQDAKAIQQDIQRALSDQQAAGYREVQARIRDAHVVQQDIQRQLNERANKLAQLQVLAAGTQHPKYGPQVLYNLLKASR